MSTVLSASNLRVSYGALRAIDGISLELEEGSAVALIGANGAGKSTLARALSGLIPVESGEIRIAGEDTTRIHASQVYKAGLTYLPEGRGVFRSLSVDDNLRMAVRVIAGRAERRRATDRVFDTFPILRSRHAQIAGTLSGGEQQMLSLAKALANWPKVLVADELGLGLAPKIIDDLYEQLGEARKRGLTILLIEQYLDRALSFADHAVVINKGQVAWSGIAADADVEMISRQYMGQSTLNDVAGSS
ncbi:MAG TPA: ABC transporter ATP-binding protein [Jatrophihabitantaceae bacterium]|nr:ABC transporter ATP-binding protein [Jatrophihabitantaceae bacterium]